MTRWRLVKLVLAVSTIAVLGLGVAAGVAASRDSDSHDDTNVALQSDDPDAKAWIGVQVHTSHDPDGVGITGIADDSPAADAGLAPDDVIVAIDGDETRNVGALKKALRDYSPGDEVTLSVVKGGDDVEPVDVTVVLGDKAAFDGILGFDTEDFQDGLLDGITEAFDRFLDDEGNTVELEAIGGNIVAISDSEITIETADGEQTFALTDDAHVSDDLAEGDRVVVVSVDGEVNTVTGAGLGIFQRQFDFDLDFDLPEFDFDFPFDGHHFDFDLPFGQGEGRFEFEFEFEFGESRFCRHGDGPGSKDDHPNLEELRDKLCDGGGLSSSGDLRFPFCGDDGEFSFGPLFGLFDEDDVREELEQFCAEHEDDG